MRYVKISFWAVLTLLLLGFFHYNLPQRDIVRVTGTEVIRADFSGSNRFFYAQPDSGNQDGVNKDLRLINTAYESGKIMVFRNEDTGLFSWPPYFKIDSSNLQAESEGLQSTRDAPIWVVITHYGWRSEFLSIYPNAVGIREISDPNVRLIPWLNIIILTTLLVLVLWLRRVWKQFRERKIDPLIDDASDVIGAVDARADVARDRARGVFGRFTAWIGTWRGKPRK